MKPRRDPPRPSPDIAALAAVRRLAGTAAMEGSIPAVWGHISGSLADQTDLAAALAAKLDDSQAGTFGLTLLAAVSLAAAKTSLAYTKSDVGLGSVDNTADAAKVVLSASKLTTARTLAATGDVTFSGSFDGSANFSAAATVVKINGVSLAGLGTGILKNTTGTGAPSIAVAADFPTFNQNTTGSAAKLTTPRTLAATGDVTWSGSFDGSANFSVTATIAANAVTFAKMVAATAASIVGATAAGNFAQLTPAQAKGVLAIAVADISGVDTDGTLAANSDSKLATQKAVKSYVDQIIAAQDAMVFKGVIDCSANPNYPAADRGHTYRVSVAGKIGGASGTNVEIGDLLLCLTDGTGAGSQATVGASWSIAQANLDGAVIGPASAADASVAGYSGTSGKLLKQLSAAEIKAAAGLGSVDNTADAAKAVLSATKLATARNIDGQSFDGSADVTIIAPGTHAATSKATPVDADELPLVDSAASNVLKKLTWANLKATLKTYFDTLYQVLNSNLTTIAGLTATTDNFIVSVSSAWASRTPAQVRATLGFGSGGYTTGTSFPGSPSTNDMCYRTDRAIEYYYDGTRWLSTGLHTIIFTLASQFQPLTATVAAGWRVVNPYASKYDIYVVDAQFSTYIVSAGTWVLTMFKATGAAVKTSIAAKSTASDAGATWIGTTVAVNAVVASTFPEFEVDANKTSGGDLYAVCALTFRLVG